MTKEKKKSKEVIWRYYAILILILGSIAYYIGNKNNKGELYASIGVSIGALLSILLWVTVGKKNY